jgi:hypothetical protein
MGVAHAASPIDFSDQWWTAGEPGWGASVLQQADTLFVNLMVHGADGKPTWYTAAVPYQTGFAPGRSVFAGELYLTNGTYYGAPWNAAALAIRKVGSLTFDAASGNAATLSYAVDGVPVVKTVGRQTWRYENLTGTYDAVWENSCGNGVWHLIPLDGFSSTTIRHSADDKVTMSVSYPFYLSDDKNEFQGTYTQAGHLGQIAADLVDPGGTVTIFEIAKTATGFTARFTYSFPGVLSHCLPATGRVVAVLGGP